MKGLRPRILDVFFVSDLFPIFQPAADLGFRA